MAKLLFYTDTDYFSGAEIYMSQLIIFASEAGHKIDVVVSQKWQTITHPLWQTVKKLPDVKLHYWATGQKLNFFRANKLWQFLGQTKPNLVIVNMWSPFANTWMLIAANRRRLPVIAFEHFYQQNIDLMGWQRPVKLFAYNLKKSLVWLEVTASNAHRQSLIEEFNYPPPLVSVLHGGVDLPQPEKPVKSYPVVELIFSGTLEDRKQPLFLIEVLKGLKDLPWRLTLLGKGPLEEETKKLIKSSGLEKRVRLLGWVPNPQKYLNQGDIFVHPAKSENYSLVLIEAMASQLPVIANRVGGNSELVEDKVTGRLLETGDVKSWRLALRDLISNQTLRENYGEAGRRKYEHEMTLAVMKQNFYRLIEKWVG